MARRLHLAAGQEGVPRKVKLFETAQNRRLSGRPGEVLDAGARGILVGCGTGSLLLREIQLEGKRRMPVRDFLIGRPVSLGTRLGTSGGPGPSTP